MKIITQEKPVLDESKRIKPKIFLTLSEWRKGEGGMRKKGLFKHNYKKVENTWYICDQYLNPVKPAPFQIQEKIEKFCRERNFFSDKLPLVSVITASLNSEKTIEESIKSVIAQSYPNLEFIIIDGGSTDRTLEIIKKYEDSIDYWVSEKDSGIYDAFNKGVILSFGKWIAFLGSDDIMFQDAIETLIKHSIQFERERGTEPDYCSGKIKILYENGKYEGIFGKRWNWIEFRFKMTTAHPASLHNRKLFDEVGLFNAQYKIAGDYELLLRKKDKLKAEFVDKVVCVVREGVSKKKGKLGLKEAVDAQVKLSILPPSIANAYFYIHYLRFLGGKLKRKIIYFLKNLKNIRIRIQIF
ncbi:PGL/p-HBAD biosynthesis glycosyltransferase [bacterium HR19]|nr:PGL/p-HBAD biosynthesis glycosyltransferase [bacterium HR19]